MNNYFVYRHIRLDKNEPFYIGIGSNLKRPYWKWGRNRYWTFITNITDWKVDIMIKDLTRIQAEEKEKEFIKLYGRKCDGTGILCNLTAGGTGGLGLKHTLQSIEKMKGRKSYNKGICKWNNIYDEVVKDIDLGFTESKLMIKWNLSKGSIYRIKSKIRKEKES